MQNLANKGSIYVEMLPRSEAPFERVEVRRRSVSPLGGALSSTHVREACDSEPSAFHALRCGSREDGLVKDQVRVETPMW